MPVVLLGDVRELEVQRERPQHVRLLGSGASARTASRTSAGSPTSRDARAPRARAPRRRGALALLLDEHPAEDVAEQADVAAERARVVLAARLLAGALLRGRLHGHARSLPEPLEA